MEFFSKIIKDELDLQRETLSIIKAAYQHKRIVNNFMECLTKLGFDENYHKDTYENVNMQRKVLEQNNFRALRSHYDI